MNAADAPESASNGEARPEAASESVPSFLRQLARRRTADQPQERCELCSVPLAAEHQHLLDPAKRQIACACDGCVILFCGQTGAHFLRIPRRITHLADFQMSDLQWESLMIPINLAFFYRDTAASRVMAIYPSPAGALESLLSLESWQEIAEQNPALLQMQPDVEALLVNRLSGQAEYLIVPIDECYHLVGLIRLHWRGLSGGAEVWTHITQFFDSLRSRSSRPREAVHA